ncbi:BCCT family transporter [Marinactinospora thermotolerans]|nr:BCCT family transporter [Marinactinospora thermotolerans]
MVERVRTRALRKREEGRVDTWVVGVSGGALIAFVAAALLFPTATENAVDTAFTWSADWFGAYWQLFLLATFLVAAVLACSRYGRVRMGGIARPEFGWFKWVAMVMTTLLGAGGVFWAAAEPIAHYVDTPPLFGTGGGATDPSPESVALAQSFIHWGFLGWAVGGTLATFVMMRGVQRGLPLRPRTLLYPIMGDRVKDHWIGTVADICCILAVVAGTVGPVGFLGLQVSYISGEMFGTFDGYATQLVVIIGLTVVAAISVLSGLDKGIQFLSRLNVWVALALLVCVLALGSAVFVFNTFFDAFALHATQFLSMSVYRGDGSWLGSWTTFFFAWWVGYAPLMAIFIARISKGRTVREIFIGGTVLPTVVTTFWFTALGGTGIWLETQNPGSVSGPYEETGLPAAALSIVQQLPMSALLGVIVLVVTVVFVASTMDSMSYALAASGMRDSEPRPVIRAFWCVVMGAAAAVLIAIGDGGVNALQSFIVVTAVPVGLIMLPTLWTTPRIIRWMAVEQGLLSRADAAGIPEKRDEEVPSWTGPSEVGRKEPEFAGRY